jgi:hypothetical protein
MAYRKRTQGEGTMYTLRGITNGKSFCHKTKDEEIAWHVFNIARSVPKNEWTVLKDGRKQLAKSVNGRTWYAPYGSK